MKIKLPHYLSALLLLVTFLQGYRKENYDVIDPEKEVFNLIVTDSQRQYINASRGEQYEINDPLPELQFAGNVYTIDRFEIRGDNTLNFTRKGFRVNLGKKITLINPEEQIERKYEEFKLLAMVYDYTYIENSTAVGLDINLSGPAVFTGTAKNPVFVTCSRKNKFWGGFITRVSGGTIEAEYTIFCQSGYHDSDGYNWGHSGRQALFYTENSTLTLNHCFMLDHIGQIFYPQNATLTVDNILVQRAQTGGQVNYSDLTIRNSVFTDFPDDSYVFRDEDNDALYLSASDAEIENTIFMFAKDDGLDSGNEEGGEINLTNCRFEACFHEGAALSSGNSAVKNHTFTECVFTNCGQGLELGFSSPNHTVVADKCLFLYNGIGIRYGDNYDWSEVDGKMLITNSFSLYNDKDVWNMVRINWSPKLQNMVFENTRVSALCPQYPRLELYR
jgi:hypothetical protein